MANTPEGRVKDKVRKKLKAASAYWHMPVQNGMGKPALDFHVCAKGFYAAVETKAPGGKPTARQVLTAAEVVRAGGSFFLIDGDTQELEMWLADPATRRFPTWLLAHLGKPFNVPND